jgi:hypothetical protein
VIVACRVGSPAPASEETGSESGSDTSTETGDPDYMDPDECRSSADCEDGEVCVAPYDPGADPPRGVAVCVGECVEALDLDKYCFDDAACCEGLSCAADGLCDEPFEGTTGTGETDTGTGTGTDTGDTGTESGGTDTGETGGTGTTG